nr:GNAT family N-acetyltransferase [uncultured Allomuricauda sp.]
MIDFKVAVEPHILAKLNKPVQELHCQRYPEFFKAFNEEACIDFFKRQLAKPNWRAYLVLVDNKNAGYASFFIKEYQENLFRKSYKSLYVDQVSVLSEFKGMGIGKQIMNKIEEEALNLSINKIELAYWELNHEARGFYEYLGYTTLSRISWKNLV